MTGAKQEELRMIWCRLLVWTALLGVTTIPALADPSVERNFAGSVQLDYMSVPSQTIARDVALDAATVELSLKLAQDFGEHVSASVKLCISCHGMEVGMAFFDLRVADELNVRVGRFTPQFGSFPLRHDPANHRTSDKPLPYDMGRMVRLQEWNLGVMPSPWVDNGIEINGTLFLGEGAQVDYATYAVAGPRAGIDATDFDYKLSRSGEAYYIDNNSQPSIGAHLAMTLSGESSMLTFGASAMAGSYDPEQKLQYALVGAHVVAQLHGAFLRAEYLVRRTEMALGMDPASRFKYGPGVNGAFDPYFLKHGFYAELEVPVGDRVDLIARWDGLRRQGNVLATSMLRSDSAVLRYTAGTSVRIHGATRLKLSGELYDFSDFTDELVFHVAVAGAL